MYNDKDPLINTYKSRFRNANGTNSWHIGLTVFTSLVAIAAIIALVFGSLSLSKDPFKSIAGTYIGKITFVDGGVEPITVIVTASGFVASVGRLEFPEFFGLEDLESAVVGQLEHLGGDKYRWASIQYRQGKFSLLFPEPVLSEPDYVFVIRSEFTIIGKEMTMLSMQIGAGEVGYSPPDSTQAVFPIASSSLTRYTIQEITDTIGVHPPTIPANISPQTEL